MNYADWLDQLYNLVPDALVTEENDEIVVYTRCKLVYPTGHDGGPIPVVELEVTSMLDSANFADVG